MKKFIQEYLKIFAYTSLGLAMIISSFYLLINFYHSSEVSKVLYISENDTNYTAYREKLGKIKSNLSDFSRKTGTSSAYKTMYNKLTTCNQVLNTDGMLSQIEVNKRYNSFDVYNLGTSFQANALNICWAVQLSYLTDPELLPKEFEDVAPLVTSSVNSIASHVDFAIDELQNNSSYFMTTKITSSTIRDYLSSDYQAIASSYNDFADIVLGLSEMINRGGNN